MSCPAAKKKHAKITDTPRFPPDIEEQIRVHGCENILTAFVAALSSLQNPINALKLELAAAFDEKPADFSTNYERAGYIYTLIAISAFLKEIGVVSYQEAFYRLAVALGDLNHGAVDPLLKPVKTGGTTKLNVSWDWCARAHVSVGIFALVKAGLTRKEAARQAAHNFPKIEKLAALSRTKQSSTATKIISWFDDFNKGTRSKILNEQALAIFASGRDAIDRLPRDDTDRLHNIASRMFALAVEFSSGLTPTISRRFP